MIVHEVNENNKVANRALRKYISTFFLFIGDVVIVVRFLLRVSRRRCRVNERRRFKRSHAAFLNSTRPAHFFWLTFVVV